MTTTPRLPRPALAACARRPLLSALLLALAGSGAAMAETRSIDTRLHAAELVTIARGVEHPWALALLPGGRYLVTERNQGRLQLGDREGGLQTVAGVPEVYRLKDDGSQSGLFDVKLAPDFERTRHVYLSYAKPTERGAALAIARGTLQLDGDAPRLADVEDFWVMQEDDQDPGSLHLGGRMAFDPDDGTLYLTIGERRNLSRAQDRDDQAGSVLRIGRDGEAAPGNPFAGDDVDGNAFVHSYGHRNPQGLAFDADGRLWLNDHGPQGGDEFNRVQAGRNYGWPLTTAGRDYSDAPIGHGRSADGVEPPVHVFDGTVAPSGLAFYRGGQFRGWTGDALNGSLRGEGIVRLTLDGERVADVERIDIGRRVRDVQVADDGAIWLVTDHEDGEVMRLVARDARQAAADAGE